MNGDIYVVFGISPHSPDEGEIPLLTLHDDLDQHEVQACVGRFENMRYTEVRAQHYIPNCTRYLCHDHAAGIFDPPGRTFPLGCTVCSAPATHAQHYDLPDDDEDHDQD